MKKNISILFVLFYGICLYGQNYSGSYKHFSKPEGLDEWLNKGNFQDSRGFVWMQWGGVLYKFNGERLEIKDKGNGLLYQNHTSAFGEDRQGNIWRIQFNNKLDLTNKISIHVYSIEQDTLLNLNNFISPEKIPNWSHKLTLYSVDRYVFVYDKSSGIIWRFNDGEFHEIYKLSKPNLDIRLAPGPEGHLWVVNFETSIVTLINDQGATIQDYGKLGSGILSYILTEEGELWYYSNTTLAKPFNLPSEFSTKQKPNQNTLTPKHILIPPIDKYGYLKKNQGIININDNDIYLRSEYNLMEALNLRGTFQSNLLQFLKPHLIDGKLPKDFFPEGNSRLMRIFLTEEGKIILLFEKAFTVLTLNEQQFIPIKKDTIMGLRGLSFINDSILLGVSFVGNKAKVNAFNINNNTLTPYKHKWRDAAFDLEVIDNDVYMVGLYGGILKSNTQTGLSSFLMRPDSSAAMQGNSIIVLNDSITYYATRIGVVEVNFSSKKRKYIFEKKDCNVIHLDKNGVLWVGTNSGLYTVKNGVHFLTEMYKGQHIRVSHIYEDPNGLFWISTQQGLIKWTPYSDSYEIYNEFPSKIIHAAYPDKKGKLWLSTNNGIVSLDTSTLITNCYSSENGLVDNEQNYISHARSPNGTLCFGGVKGITCFHPDSIDNLTSAFKYDIHIERVETYDLEGKKFNSFIPKLSSDERYKLPKYTQNLNIKVDIPYYETSPKTFEWRFKGANQKWRLVPDDNNIFLLNLPSGDFTIQFKVKSNISNAHILTREIHFNKTPPIYHHVFFWVLVALLILYFIWLFIRIRTKLIRSRNEELNDLVDQKTEELKRQKISLEELDEKKNQLFQNISHELRTPLSLISLATENLTPSEKENNDIDLIVSQTEILKARVEEILALRHLNEGMLAINLKRFEWKKFIESQFVIFEGQAQEKQIFYNLIIIPNQATEIETDAIKLGHIIGNLLSNALKYTQDGGRVTLRSEIKDNSLEIMVADNGPGIEEKEQELIFNRGYQGASSASQANPGYGIGLSLCKEYTELLNGKLWVESRTNEGAKFIISIPIKVFQQIKEPSVSKTVSPQTPSLPQEVVFEDRNRPYILIVEDNQLLRSQIEKILSSDYNVASAENGKIALDLLLEKGQVFDLIVSDIMMPYLNGYDLLVKVRKNPELGFIPFIFLTALASEDDKLKAFRLGIDGFIRKPFEKAELLTLVENKIKVHEIRKSHFSKVYKDNGINLKSNFDNKEKAPIITASYDNEWIQNLEKIVRDNLSKNKFKITDIAYQLHLSERTFRNQVKLYTGLTPLGYLQKARLDQAMIFLQEKKYRTVSEVAYAVGFIDSKYFSRIFKKEFGKSPSAFTS